MKILVIGNDPKIFDESSENFKRIKEYAELFDEYHIVSPAPIGASKKSYNNRLFLWPAKLETSFFIGKEIIKRFGPDIIDSQDAGEHGFICFLLSKIYSIPFRIQIHTDIMSPWYRRASWKERIRYYIAKFLIPRADCLRVVSERIKKSIVQNTKYKIPDAKISVLPIFTDISSFLNAKPDPVTVERFKDYEFKMIAVGRFVDKEKNLSMLIDMMPEFLKVCPKALLVLVGEGPDKQKYKERIKNYGLEKYVILEKWSEDLPSFYKAFDLYLMSSNYEGWGRTVIEAMASGLPVVMTDVGLAVEIVKNGRNGMIVPVGRKEEFLKTCVVLSTNFSERLRFSEKSKEVAITAGFRSKEAYLEQYKKSFGICII